MSQASVVEDDVQNASGVSAIPSNRKSNEASTSSVRKSKNVSNQRESQITTKLSYRTRYSKFDTTAIHLNETRNKIPVIEPKAGKYSPIPYIFRIPPKASEGRTVKTMVRCPALHVQLDHTIAVVWSLYSTEETPIPIGINQLHWAYNFLDTIKDRQHNHPRDVQHSLNSIADDLIEQYTELATDFRSRNSSEDFGDPLASSTPKSQDGSNQCVCPSKKTKRESAASMISSTSSQKDYPFSVNYNDMTLHSNVKESKGGKTFNKNSGKAGDFDMDKLLKEWRQEQFSRILADLDELQVIEKYMNQSAKPMEISTELDEKEIEEFIARKLKIHKKECSKM